MNFPVNCHIAESLNANLLLTHYHLCPEETIQTALEDCYALYRYAVDELNYNPKQIHVQGDSAGIFFQISIQFHYNHKKKI